MAISPARASLVLAKYRFKRLWNMLMRRKKADATGKRGPTRRKNLRGGVTALVLGLFILFGSGAQSGIAIYRIFAALGCQDQSSVRQPVDCVAKPSAKGRTVPEGVHQALALELHLLFLVALMLNVASRELASGEWDLEWLYTLPIPFSTLIGSRVVERTLVNASGIIFLLPFVMISFWHIGWGYSAIPLGLMATLLLLFFGATISTLMDTGLRLLWRPSRLRNFQATMSIVSTAGMLLALSVNMSEKPFLFNWALSYPSWLNWEPIGLLASVMTSDGSNLIGKVLALLCELIAGYLAMYSILRAVLREGVVSGSSREGVLRKAAPVARSSSGGSFFKPLQRKDIKLLARDRNFLVQTILLPGFIIGMQVFFRSGQPAASTDFGTVATLSFAMASYSLLFSAFQVLNAEGAALWLLYTFPRRLEDMIKDKAIFWLGVALCYPVLVFGYQIIYKGLPGLGDAALMAIALLGVPVYAVVAACLGVFACNPLAEDQRQKVRVDFLYLYMVLSGFYTYAIFAESYWSKLALIVLSALMALALWQKARDHLPYLLDPAASPKAAVSVADGLIAALAFLVIQGIAGAAMALAGHEKITGRDLTIAFSIAGFVTFTVVRIVYWRKKTTGVPAMFGKAWPKGILVGALLGALAAVIGLSYLLAMDQWGWFVGAREFTASSSVRDSWWLLAITVLAAPLFEEFIFRGLIFGGLKRSWGVVGGALASAAIFAIVHPPVAVLPVFCLGVLAAAGYAWTGILLTPILSHAIYNAILVLVSGT